MSRISLANAILLASALVGVARSATEAAPTPTVVQQLVQESSLIFTGTARALQATTLPIIQATEGTAVVHVDEIVYNAGVVTDVLGHDITVRLRAPGSLKDGEHAIFFSNVDTYGESIAVGEIAHLPSNTESLQMVRRQIEEYQARRPDEKLKERIAQADLIVTGTVTAVHPTAEAQQRPPASEHDPQWWEATLKPETVEKGPAQTSAITFYFPSSDDVRWFGSPKFKAGQQGVFILHRTTDERVGVNGFTALSASDFQSMSQRENLQKLIRETR